MSLLRVVLLCSVLVVVAADGKVVGGKVMQEGQELDSEQTSALPDTSGEQHSTAQPCVVKGWSVVVS